MVFGLKYVVIMNELYVYIMYNVFDMYYNSSLVVFYIGIMEYWV